MPKHSLSVLLFLVAFPMIGFSQFGFVYNDSVDVLIGGSPMDNPWGGGLNYAQFSDFDFDFDGDLDLFVFDRSSHNIRVFTQENEGGNKFYKLFYKARDFFPADMRYRAALVDYDMDGKKDLFTYASGGMKVYRNVGDATNGLQWELYQDLIYSQYPDAHQNLLIYNSDIPAIVDVDFDGDIDILTFGNTNQHMQYHQNQSMELYGIPDSLIFVQRNECWGKFAEDANTNTIYLNDPNFPCSGGNIGNPIKSTRHAGATTLALDIDNSGVMDLVIGDASFPNLNLLINGGTAPNTDSPMISVDSGFPSNTTPVDLQLFPAPFWVDVDFDGVKDLIVGANARTVSQNAKSVNFYKNTGSNTLPNFVYVQNDFLQDQMIEHGKGSIPIFTDINEDGLEDLIVASYFRYKPVLQKESTLLYYRNTGTASDPQFTYIDDDYMNLSNAAYGLRSVPAFGDLDNDGDADMILGTENGTVVYFENQSTGSGAVYSTGVVNYTDDQGQVITSGGFSAPQLFDLNDDGLLDLILGRKNGRIFYYENVGTAQAPSFKAMNGFLGGIDVSPTNAPDGLATPHFFRHSDTTYLFCGNVDGDFNYYKNIDGNLDSSSVFTLITDNYLDIQAQGLSSFWVNDLNNDGNLELYVGQDLGGLYRFEADPLSSASINELVADSEVSVYPNPTSEQLTISVNDLQLESLTISDMRGRTIFNESQLATSKWTINTTDFPRGIYVIKVGLSNGQLISKKVVKN